MTRNRFTLDSIDSPDYAVGFATRLFAELAALPVVAALFLLVFTSLPATPPVPVNAGAVVVFSILVGIVRALYLGLSAVARRAPAAVREVFG